MFRLKSHADAVLLPYHDIVYFRLAPALRQRRGVAEHERVGPLDRIDRYLDFQCIEETFIGEDLAAPYLPAG